jgi:ATP-dependent Clp protease protease subunit
MSAQPIHNLVPTVIEQSGRGERAYDIFSLLLKERVVFVGTAINAQMANLIVAQLLYLNREDPEQEIQMYIQSPGGEVYAGLAIYDTMQQVSSPVSTVAVGLTASFGTILLAGGAPGRRHALPHATIHMHQPLGGAQGQASDIQIHAEQLLRIRDRVEGILSEHTGKPTKQIREDIDRDVYLSAEQAVEYGLIDAVLESNGREG